jgi:hypothetical protein
MSPVIVQVVLVNPGDAPFQTKLCSGQDRFFQAMEKSFTSEERHLYGEYFHKCRDKFVTTFPTPPLARIPDPGYYAVMEAAMRDDPPEAFYENSELVTWLIFSVVKRLPFKLADRARLALMRLPVYNKNK